VTKQRVIELLGLLREVERRVNRHVFHREPQTFASIPANRDRDLDLLLMEAADTIEGQQAKIDALMLEYCPDEMTPEQKAEWARNQRPLTIEEQSALDRALCGPVEVIDEGSAHEPGVGKA